MREEARGEARTGEDVGVVEGGAAAAGEGGEGVGGCEEEVCAEAVVGMDGGFWV